MIMLPSGGLHLTVKSHNYLVISMSTFAKLLTKHSAKTEQLVHDALAVVVIAAAAAHCYLTIY